ncbi:MAG: A/G-specific adenine glycosylase [Chrysiogenetes bacterium]|nr:A/G-specific adenine glycosylase [Chrysiogenetes bacterium]
MAKKSQTPESLPARRAAAIARRLEAWFAGARREMPWREDRDPYRVWLSEIMLQQTRVATVIPYFEKFTAKFPRVEALAAADEQDVLSLWSGLGYYARARSLHKAAKVVANEFGGKFPESAEALRALPGVGPYTAGAIASIAFDEPAPAVDGNVVRVLSRLLAWQADTADPAARRAAEPLVTQILERGAPHVLTQAIMELGATLCLPANPACGACPLASICEAKKADKVARFPLAKARKKPKAVHLVALALLDSKGRVLMQKREGQALFGGLWEIPHLEVATKKDHAAALKELAALQGQKGAGAPAHRGQVSHALTHRKFTLDLYAARAARAVKASSGRKWIDPHDPGALPLSSFQRKLLARLGQLL